MKPRIVLTLAESQLGNQLNLFATFAAVARERGAVVLSPAFGRYADDFASTRRSLFCRYPYRPGPARPPAAARRKAFDAAVKLRDYVRFRQHLDPPPPWTRGMETRVLNSGEPYVHVEDWTRDNGGIPRRALFINGYHYRARPLVEKHRTALIDFFKPIKKHRDAAAEAAGLARADATKLVAVHIRWSDYKTYRDGQFYYDLDTYKALMRRAQTAFAGESVRFLVCCTDPLTAGDFAGLPVGFGPGSAVGDLHALAECDAILGPPSSFSAWASFVGGALLYHVADPARPVTPDCFTPSPVPRTDWTESER